MVSISLVKYRLTLLNEDSQQELYDPRQKTAKNQNSCKFIFLTYVSTPAVCHKENEIQTGNTGLFY